MFYNNTTIFNGQVSTYIKNRGTIVFGTSIINNKISISTNCRFCM